MAEKKKANAASLGMLALFKHKNVERTLTSYEARISYLEERVQKLEEAKEQIRE